MIRDPFMIKQQNIVQYWTAQGTTTGYVSQIQPTNGYKMCTVMINGVCTVGGKATIEMWGGKKEYGQNVSSGSYREQIKIAKTSDGLGYGLSNTFQLQPNMGSVVFRVDVSRYAWVSFRLASISAGADSTATTVTLSLLLEQDLVTSKVVPGLFDLIDDDYIKLQRVVTQDDVSKLAGIYRDTAVWIKDGSPVYLQISLNGIEGARSSIAFNSANFPNLLDNSGIDRVLILPYQRDNTESTQNLTLTRICVITNLGQIYHNYPDRASGYAGTSLEGDAFRFDESVIWDIPGRRFPSVTTDNSYYVKNPALPTESYIMHPPISSDNGYGNGGFPDHLTRTVSGASKTFNRFYIHQRYTGTVAGGTFTPTSPLFFMGGFEPTMKMSVIGIYRGNNTPNTAARICILGTSDGGRQWFNKYEFSSIDDYQNYGNPIDLALLYSSGYSYIPGSYQIQRKTNIVPTAGTPNPTDIFGIGSPIVVSSFDAQSNVIQTQTAHGFASGTYPVIFFTKVTADVQPGYDWMINASVSSTSAGTGMFFKCSVIDSTHLALYEYIHNPSNNLSARHIHSINRQKDGFIIGTGEDYPDGWCLYMQMPQADIYAPAWAWMNYTVKRLNSSNTSVQRILGMHLYDSDTPQIMFGSDETTLLRPTITLPSGDTFQRTSSGVFKGNLSDIDDFTKMRCVYESTDVCYFFKRKLGVLIYVGNAGDLALSWDEGNTWKSYRIEYNFANISRFYGQDSKQRLLIEDFLLTLKK